MALFGKDVAYDGGEGDALDFIGRRERGGITALKDDTRFIYPLFPREDRCRSARVGVQAVEPGRRVR
jgi:hypothetical protein